jgi:hypothetical protein
MTLTAHGTTRGYWNGCHCSRCKAANANYHAARRQLVAYGRWAPYIEGDIVRDHIRDLMENGVGYRAVAELAGLPHKTIQRILYGHPARQKPPTKRVRARTAAALLAVGGDAA